MNLPEMGQLIRQRREALGLSQGLLARMGGLSRATVNQLENGTLVDLGAAKLLALLHLLGLDVQAGPAKPPQGALRSLSQTASVSYARVLEPQALRRAWVKGELPPDWLAHVSTLVDEAPMPLIVAAVEEIAAQTHIAPKTLWKHLSRWAQELGSPRPVWV